MDLQGRTLLGKYRIDGLLGQGGMGSVWRGAHVLTGRKVAIKLLDERFLSQVSVVQRFGREARAASAIQHEGIVEVLDLDQTEEGVPFLVMEFLEGETLSRRIERKGKLSQDETLRIATGLLEALEAAHRHGVVHRDLKPDNIFLVPAGRRGEIVKILDFGISHKADEAQAKLTVTGSVLGTPHYMSPEQAMGETNLDRRVDIYAVGVVLYECLVGEVPFDAPNYNKLLRVILDEAPVPPSARGAIVEPEVEQVILAAMAKDRDARPQSAGALLEMLQAATNEHTERFEAEAVAALREARAERDPAERRRTASASFRRPVDEAGDRPRGPTPRPFAAPTPNVAPQKAADEPRTSRTPMDEPRASRTPMSDLGLDPNAPLQAPAPAARPASAPLLLEEPVGAGALGVFDDGARPAVAIELDESALAPRTSATPSSAGTAASTGPHRAISERSLPAQRATPASTTPVHPLARHGRPSPSSDRLEAVRVSAPPEPDVEPAKPAAPTLRERWDALPEPVRRWTPRALAGLLAFVLLVWAVRAVVRPVGPGPIGDSSVGVPARTEASARADGERRPEWYLVEVDGVPPRARLVLDGLPGATLPLRVRPGAHVLEIRAPGYEDRRIEFTAGGNMRLRAGMRPAVGTGQPVP